MILCVNPLPFALSGDCFIYYGVNKGNPPSAYSTVGQSGIFEVSGSQNVVTFIHISPNMSFGGGSLAVARTFATLLIAKVDPLDQNPSLTWQKWA